MHNVFTYGILMRRGQDFNFAILPNYKRVKDSYYIAMAEEGKYIAGDLHIGLDDRELADLDRIERVDDLGLYKREMVTVIDKEGNPVEAWVYVAGRYYDSERERIENLEEAWPTE
jgi:hypothetical protein